MNLRAAIAQIDSRLGDLKNNVEHHLEFVDRAIRQKAQLIVFPELSLTGYTLRDLAWDIAIDPESDPLLEPLKKKSKKISMVVGFVENGPRHGVYNSAMLLEDGLIKHIHRKVYPPTYGLFEEGRYFSRGSVARACQSKHGRIGMLICEDMWHLSLPYLLAMDGAEAILSLTASPTRLAGSEPVLGNARVNHEHTRTFARLLSTYVLFANRVGFEDGINFWGSSMIAGPAGEQLVEGKEFEEDLIVTELSSSEVRRARRFSRHFLDEDPQIVLRALQQVWNSEAGGE